MDPDAIPIASDHLCRPHMAEVGGDRGGIAMGARRGHQG
jgi:hypothetical protein